jgi:chaperonin GroES
MKKIQVLGTRVLIESAPKEETKNGIYIPKEVEGVSDGSLFGKVVNVGPDVKTVKVGDTVMYQEYGFDEIEFEKKKYVLVREEALLAIVK